MKSIKAFVNIVCLSGFENFISYSLIHHTNKFAKTLNGACLCVISAEYCLCFYNTLILIASIKASHNNLRSLYYDLIAKKKKRTCTAHYNGVDTNFTVSFTNSKC